ncbi:MAG TPA: hypothetical protein PLD25_12515 [Chloroflexota bacterium]|nr:hypothetical protein [Chloroflexota bacterium]
MSVLRRHVLLATAVCSAAVALALYWPIRQLPLAFDDLLHIRLVKGLNYATVWLPSTDFAYFRPVLFLPVMLANSLFGHYPAPFLYGLNWLLHAANAALVAALAWRLWRRGSRALAAGLLLACYPFSFQAVAVFGNNIYLLLLLLTLLALHAYLWALEKGGWWWVVTAVLFLIGLLAHELMVLFGVYAALTQWAYTDRLEIRAWRWQRDPSPFVLSPYLFFLLAGAIYIVCYQFLPLASPPQSAGDNWLALKLLYFGQALVYPLARLGARLLPQNAPLIIVMGLLLILIWTGLAARQPGNRLALLLGWGWWGVTAVLLTITLPTNYILHGPRLHYLGSVGVCLLWAVLLDSLFDRGRVEKLLWAMALGLLLLVGGFFVRGRVAALANLGAPVAVVQAEMAARPLAEGVLLVNLPAWAAPAHNTFPVGVEHVALMGDHIFAEELVWENLNQVRPVRAVELPELRQAVDYPYGLLVQSPDLGDPADWAAAGASVFISRFTETGMVTEFSGRFFPAEDTAVPPQATWGDTALLDGTAVACDGQITTDLTWQLATIAATTSVFVQVLDGDGRLLGQADGPPLQLRPDWLALPPGWWVQDHRQIEVAGTAALADSHTGVPVTLLIGLYDYVSGARSPGVDATQHPLPDNAFRLAIQPCAAPPSSP